MAQKFGEILITTHHDNSHQAKLANHGTSEIWVELAEGHPVGTYHAFNLRMRKNSLTNDVTFLGKSLVSGKS